MNTQIIKTIEIWSFMIRLPLVLKTFCTRTRQTVEPGHQQHVAGVVTSAGRRKSECGWAAGRTTYSVHFPKGHAACGAEPMSVIAPVWPTSKAVCSPDPMGGSPTMRARDRRYCHEN